MFVGHVVHKDLAWPALNRTLGRHQHRGCSSKHNSPCFSPVTREKLLFSHFFPSPPLLRSLLFIIAPSVPYLHHCHLYNPLKTLHCLRLNYNLDVADRLADEHALIALYVNLLQNKPSTWSVGVMLAVPSSTGRHFAVLSCHLVTFTPA